VRAILNKEEDPHPAISRKRERVRKGRADEDWNGRRRAPLLPLAGEGWDEGLLLVSGIGPAKKRALILPPSPRNGRMETSIA
jgi:hypothetical protein